MAKTFCMFIMVRTLVAVLPLGDYPQASKVSESARRKSVKSNHSSELANFFHVLDCPDPLASIAGGRPAARPGFGARGDASQSYALYLPVNYAPGHPWPVLYCLDPGARGRVPVDRFSKAAEKAGFIVVGSNNSQNGALPPLSEPLR